ncbi:anthrone oxygenase family protein [Streptomyces sp. NPDC028635]|uniref:anthrone oxygenase family protein n=1 Tax=Streptomyces sp. NPDC028635 TaxID=3154800 RepID=UPI0033CC3361
MADTTDNTPRSTAARTVLGAAAVTSGLLAGVFLIFACAVMPALARSDDRGYVEVMRNINDVIQNPLFMLVFLGAPALTAAAAWQARTAPGRGRVWAALAASVLAFAVTVAVNVPLNDALARPGDPAALREHFEDPWVTWNAVRTALTTLATVLLTAALPTARHLHPAPPTVKAPHDSALR